MAPSWCPAALIAATAAWACAAPSAWAQLAGQMLPSSSGGGGGGLRSTVQQLLPSAPASSTGSSWTYGASLDVSVGVTDSPYGSNNSSNTRSFEFTTVIQPNVYVKGDTRRLSVNLYYSPQIILYGSSSQDYVANNLNGSATLTVVPDTFFIDARAYTTTQSRFGGVQAPTSNFLSRNDAVQSASFSVTPYLEHRFGGWGTGKVGVSYSSGLQGTTNGTNSVFNSNSAFNSIFNSGAVNNGLNGYGTTGNVNTTQEFGSFITGENLNRFQNSIDTSATQYQGGGSVYKGAHRNSASDTISFAVNHALSFFVSFGYEDIAYGASSGQRAYRVNDATWSVGTTWAPNPDSSLKLAYGHQNGSTSLQFDGSYTPTARIRLTGSYSEGVTTGLEQQLALLQSTSVGPGGLLVDSKTGAPVASNTGFGLFNNVSRVKTLSAAAYYLLNRETFGASFVSQEATSLTNSTSVIGAAVAPGTSATSRVATVSWQHDLNPATSLSSSVSYGTTGTNLLLGNSTSGTQNTFSAATSLSHVFTETLSGSVSYQYYDRGGGGTSNLPSSFGGNATQNSFFVSLHKSF